MKRIRGAAGWRRGAEARCKRRISRSTLASRMRNNSRAAFMREEKFYSARLLFADRPRAAALFNLPLRTSLDPVWLQKGARAKFVPGIGMKKKRKRKIHFFLSRALAFPGIPFFSFLSFSPIDITLQSSILLCAISAVYIDLCTFKNYSVWYVEHE